MIERVNPIMLPNGAPLGKIKGHTRIELTTVATGEKKIIEHDNTFQNLVLSNFLRSMGQANNSPFANATWNDQKLYRNLTGGILLFANPIDDSQVREFALPGNTMTANGSFGVTNTGTPTELGSYNATESAFGFGSASFVYDWDTSHGNGTIGCVCLSSELGGFIGYGNASGNAATAKNWNLNQDSTRVLTTSNIDRDIHGNMRYQFTLDRVNKKLTVTKIKVALTNASLFSKTSDSIEIQINYTFWTGTNNDSVNCCCGLDGKFRIFPPTSSTGQEVSNGSNIVFIEYDPTNDTAVMRTVTNTTGETLRARNRTYCDGTYLYIGKAGSNGSEAKPTYAIRLSDSTTMGSLTTSAGSATDGFNTYLALGPGYVLAALSSSTARALWAWDVANDTKRITNGKNDSSSERYRTDAAIDACVSSGEVSSGHKVYKNPLYLATINNLDTAITKDSTQTMKIIYTLTEASA